MHFYLKLIFLSFYLGCVRCCHLAFTPLLFSVARLGYDSLVRDVFLNSRLRHVTGTLIPVMCLSLTQTLYSSISRNPRKCLFRAVPLNATYRRPPSHTAGSAALKSPSKKKSSAGRCVLSSMSCTCINTASQKVRPPPLPGTLNHMSKIQENNILAYSYREKRR